MRLTTMNLCISILYLSTQTRIARPGLMKLSNVSQPSACLCEGMCEAEPRLAPTFFFLFASVVSTAFQVLS